MIYAAPCEMFLMGANPLRGPYSGVGPKNSDLNMSNFLKIKDLTVVKIIILVLKFSSHVILKSMYLYLKTKFKFLSIENQVLLNKICIRILSAPDLDLNQLFGFGSGSGSCKKVRILSDPDRHPQH